MSGSPAAKLNSSSTSRKRILVPAGVDRPRAPSISREWTEARVAQLKQLCGEGFNASQIAAKMGNGLTRNAVIGKIHRLKKMPVRPSKPARIDAPLDPKPAHAMAIGHKPLHKRGRVMNPKGDKFAPVEHTALVAERFAEGYLGQRGKVALADLIGGQCRFPIDQPTGGLLYCGDGVTDGSSYCAHHHERCCPGDVQPKRKPRVPFLLERTSFERI